MEIRSVVDWCTRIPLDTPLARLIASLDWDMLIRAPQALLLTIRLNSSYSADMRDPEDRRLPRRKCEPGSCSSPKDTLIRLAT
jgi:hypothetical protein